MTLFRYAVSLALMVAIIGGVAWVVQYLPRWQAVQKPAAVPREKELVRFALGIANAAGQVQVRAFWNKADPMGFREYEPGDFGHYDFLFKNYLGEDIELTYYSSSCDCASMLACVLPSAEAERLGKIQAEDPGAELSYQVEPKWEELPRDPLRPIHLVVKANEGGAVRVRWAARRTPGSGLRVEPSVHVQPAGDPSGQKKYMLLVPALMTHPVRIYPPRVNVGTLIPGSVVKAEFDAWSPTRDQFKLELTQPPGDPFFAIETRLLTKDENAALERSLQAKQIPTHVKAAYHVTITIHESKAGQQLDLGTFFRKFAIVLDGNPMVDLPGPEITGRVQGDLVIGGADDMGKIRFKSFDLAGGASKTVGLLAAKDANLELVKNHSHQPTWLQIRLTRDEQVIDGKKRIWHLEVTVPPKTLAARSFDEPDAVVLQTQIKGQPPRMVRIPIEGHVSGR